MMNPRAPSRRGAAPRAQPRLASGRAAHPKSGLLRRVGRIALYGAIGFIIGSIVVVALYRFLPPPGTPLMLIRRVEGYGIDKSWRPLDEISPHLIRAAMAGEDARFCRHHGFDWGAIRPRRGDPRAHARRPHGAAFAVRGLRRISGPPRHWSAAPNPNRTGALNAEKRWRETGAKEGDFRLHEHHAASAPDIRDRMC